MGLAGLERGEGVYLRLDGLCGRGGRRSRRRGGLGGKTLRSREVNWIGFVTAVISGRTSRGEACTRDWGVSEEGRGGRERVALGGFIPETVFM